MGYYDNPTIVQPGKGSEMISEAIAGFGSNIAKGLIARSEREREEAKEKKLTIQKLQDKKNETDLYYNDKLSDWNSKQPNTGTDVDKQIFDIIQQKITLAADSNIALLNETDQAKRQEYLKNIQQADGAIANAQPFAKRIGGQVATNRIALPGVKVGEAGGWLVNGKDDAEMEDNQGVLDILGKRDHGYTDTKINVTPGPNGNDFVLMVSGKHANGRAFTKEINSTEYLKGEEDGDNALLMPVESLGSFNDKALEVVADKKGDVRQGYLRDTTDTVDLPANKQGDVYQIVGARALQLDAIKAEINKKSEVEAVSRLSADSQSRLRTFFKGTLKQPFDYYDQTFKKLDPATQKTTLSSLLTETTLSGMLVNFPKVTKDGETTYYNPQEPTRIKPKTAKIEKTNPSGMTGTQKNQVDFNARVKDVIATGQGGVMKNGYTLEKNEQGLWSLRDKDGLPKPGTENQHDPYALQKYIGGTLKRPLK